MGTNPVAARASAYPLNPSPIPSPGPLAAGAAPALPRPVVLVIGGSDSSGGAGVQADLKTVAALGGYARTAVTAVTAQHSGGVVASDAVSPSIVEAQIAAAFEDSTPAAVKAGMLTTAAIVEAVAVALHGRPVRPFVLDPVIRSSSGAALLEPAGVQALVRSLLPIADLVTPNAAEAETLTGMPVRSVADAEVAGRRLLDLGARAVLVKGGHLERDRAHDVLVTRDAVRVFAGTWVAGRDVHGTGCAYASAIATRLALGDGMEAAVAAGKRYIEGLIASAARVGEGALVADHFAPGAVGEEA